MPHCQDTYTTKFVWIFLALVLLWGGILRFYQLGAQSIWIDESFSALAAEKIAETGSPLLDSDIYYGRSKPHTYLLALLFKIFGKNSFILRLPSAFFGTAMIFLAAVSCRIFYGRWLSGLAVALLISLNYYEIGWSRQIRMYMEFQFFFSLTLLLLFICTAKAKKSLLLLCSLLLSHLLTIMLHKSGVLIVIPALAMTICYRQNLSRKTALTVGLLITSSLIYYFRHELTWNTMSELPVASFSDPVQLPVQFIHYVNFLLHNHSLPWAGFLLGIFFLARNKTRVDIVLITTFLSILVLISSHKGILMRSLFFTYPIFFYAASHGFIQAIDFAMDLFGEKGKSKKRSPIIYSSVLGILATGILVTSLTNNQHVLLPRTNYFLEFDSMYSGLNTWDYTPQPDFDAAYKYIREHSSKKDVYIVAHSALHHWYLPDTKTYWLGFLFIDDSKRGNFIGTTKNGNMVDRYMNYPSITTKEDMEKIFTDHHGFVIIDYYAMSTKTPPGYVQYLLEQAPVIFHNDAHPGRPWTRVWVGRF